MNLVKSAIVSIGVLALVGCGPSGGGGDNSAYAKSLSTKMISSSNTLSTSMDMFGDLSMPGVSFVADTSGLSSSASPAAKALARHAKANSAFRDHHEDDEDFNPFEFANEIVELFIGSADENGTISKTGNVYTITLDSSICDDQDSEDQANCVEVIGNLKIVLTDLGAGKAKAEILYNNLAMVTIDHHENILLSYIFNLTNAKPFLEVMVEEGDDIPDTFAGELQVKGEILGADHGMITVNILQDISIGEGTTDEFQIDIAAANNLFVMIGNDGDNSGNLDINFAGATIQAPWNNDAGTITRDATIVIPDLTVDLDFTGNGEGEADDSMELDVTLGQDGDDLTLTLDDTSAVTLYDFLWDTTLTEGQVTFNQALNFSLETNNDVTTDDNANIDFIENDLFVELDVVQGTQLQEVNTCGTGADEEGTLVETGSVSMEITVDNVANVSATFNAGTCFAEDE